MIRTNLVRRIDDLGRIVIPKEVRKQALGSEAEGVEMEFFYEKDGTIIMKPFKPFIYHFQNYSTKEV